MANHACGRDAGAVTISVQEYNTLLDTGRKYHALRQALLIGGATGESLDVLISSCSLPTPAFTPNDSPIEETTPDQSGMLEWTPAPTASPFTPRAPPSTTSSRHQNPSSIPTTLGSSNPWPPGVVCADGSVSGQLIEDPQEDESACSDNITGRRSLVLTGLPPDTTLQRLAKLLKGGAILQMHLSKRHDSAHVSFVDPIAAESFLEYVQTNEIYIQGKKVTASWDKQQRFIKPYLAKLIAFSGLTRNLVIRFAKEEWTAQSIREDLEHIHQLEIVDSFFRNGHAYLSLNSIQHALTARTCMHSQLKYKKLRIDSWPDDCAQPLPNATIKQPQYLQPVQPAAVHRNRFAPLYPGNEESQESLNLIHSSEY
ncbi:hypothetical protein A1O7_05477 [Cladophialophora yegresii CBS 114405]|uniref:RRM domain-containing protein n=1 Tax=Cladophialophora yegresii CBS 114405 TaxID=1182544 RepID=W9WHS5_9EURO|nr:uncharacterized protein A1O7_05477 [Cladophialophora yegresii CBS 114405]EXJ58054.1 hypothetical protein A1O7_05477 [Cladophialophora yegresii CBS 114405]